MAVGEATTGRDQLISVIDAATSRNLDARLFLRADKSVPYGDLLAVLDRMRAAGYLKVGLVALEAGTTEPAVTHGGAGAP